MTKPKIYIDGILQTWGDELFGSDARKIRSRKATTGVPLPSRTKSGAKRIRMTGAARIRLTLALTTRKAPEVVVKISGGGRGAKAVRAHIDYISRNGEVPVENQDGDHLIGRGDIRYLKEELQYGGFGIPEDSNVREAFNIVFSMPPGTDRAAVHDAVRSFAAEEFGIDFRYVFASHADEAHPHVHLCVIARANDGTRLNPRKADLQEWRESFASQLRDRGIEANATRRQARGVIKQSEPQSLLNMANKRGAKPDRTGKSTDNRLSGRRRETDRKVQMAYGAIARSMAESEDVADRKAAIEIVRLVKEMPAVRARHSLPAIERPYYVRVRPTKGNDRRPPSVERGGEDPTR